MRIAQIQGKIEGIWRISGNDAQNCAFYAAIRVRNGPSSEDDILLIIPQILKEILGAPWVSEMDPFLVS